MAQAAAQPLDSGRHHRSVRGKDDHIWVLNRPRDRKEDEVAKGEAECCPPAPAVLEFDTAGNLLKAWGKPDMVPGWPQSEHTIFTDNEGNVYFAGAQPGDTLLKFTGDGKFVKDFGHRGPKVARGQPQNRIISRRTFCSRRRRSDAR